MNLVPLRLPPGVLLSVRGRHWVARVPLSDGFAVVDSPNLARVLRWAWRLSYRATLPERRSA